MSSEMDEIWELFADDGQQALDAMETALDALQDGADDPTEHISALFRAVHTFKGNSRVLGLSVVESRAHLAEDLIGLVRDDGVPFDDDILDLMFLAGDTLRSMLEDVAANRADVDPEPSQDLLDQLKAMIAKVDPKADPADAPQEAAAEEASAAPEPAPEPEPTPEPEVAPEPEPAPAPEPEAVAEPTPEPTAAPDTAPEPAAAAGGAMADMNALFAEMGDSSFQNDDDALSFDEDLSEEELAAKEAARSADMEEAEAERPVQHGDAVVSSVVIDETPIDNFAQDPTYMKIWEEMTEDLVAKLEEIKTSDDGFDDRKLKTERQVDGLLHAAGQMGFPNWVSLLEDFAFDCPAIGDEAALVAAIDALLRDIEALKNGDAPSARPAATAPEPDATAPDTSGHVEPNPDAKLSDDPSYRAIFAEMADDLIARLKQGTDKDSAAQRDDAVAQVGGLLHAARQMEFDHWIATLEGFEESGPNLADGAVANAVAQLIADLEVLQQGGTPSAAAAPEAGPVTAAAPEPKAEPAAAPVADPAPAAEPAPVAEKSATDQQAESSLAAQDACTSGEARKLSDDPTYRAIFAEMCEEFMGQLKDDLASGGSVNDRKTALRKHCDGLHHAASQMGFDPWIEVLDGFVDQLHDHGDLTALDGAVKKLIADAEALAATGGVAPSVESSEADNLFRQLEPYYAAIAEAVMFVEENPDEARKELGKLAATVIELIEPHGLVRAMDAINRLAKADQVKTARVEQLTFYEELIGYEQIMPAENRISGDLVVRPSNLVRQWATDQIFETLNALRLKIDRDTLTNEGMNWFAGFNHLMRLVYHACNHYRMETAANLTMALVDLFGRVKQSTNVADALMLHMARGFLDTIELVFEALDQGDEPDMDRVEELFEEATNITFQQGGVVSARTIERKLRLPEEFHRVLSPESVKTAHKALEEKKHFYIIRTDLNEDEVLAEKFLEWIGAGHAQMVTNVTIFQDDKTLFDFLLASELEQDGIVAAMTNMDPAADKLFMRMVLDPDYSAFEEDDAGEEEGNRQSSSEGDEGPGISLSMMETIGEISAGQAMVHHILEELMSNDIVQSVDNLLRRKAQQFGGGLDQPTQSAIRGLIEDYAHKVARAAEAESQLNTQMSRLQEETAKLRERKASILLRTLAAFVEARSRTVGNEARMSHSGGDVVVDQAMMDGLQRFLKRLIRSRLVKEGAPRKMHLGLNRTDNSVSVVLSDDGEVAVDPALIKDLEAEAVRKGGEFRVAPVPQGGQSFHLRLPVHMALLEGMVVRVGEVRYVVPVGAIERIQLGSSDALLPIPAQKNAAMLRTDTGELAPIRQLSVINGGMGIADAAASAKASGKKTQSLYVVLRNEDRRFAIPVDEMLGQQLVLLRPLQGPLTGIRNMMGLALLSGGEVGMVVAVDRLAEAA